jgi:hypothetical protein
MTSPDDLDVFIAQRLAESDCPDEGFTFKVEERLAAHRRRRKSIVAIAGILASVASAVATVLTPSRTFDFNVSFLLSIGAVLAIASCAFVWIETETA